MQRNLTKYRVLVGYGNYKPKTDQYIPVWFPVDFYASDIHVRNYLIYFHGAPSGRVYDVIQAPK